MLWPCVDPTTHKMDGRMLYVSLKNDIFYTPFYEDFLSLRDPWDDRDELSELEKVCIDRYVEIAGGIKHFATHVNTLSLGGGLPGMDTRPAGNRGSDGCGRRF